MRDFLEGILSLKYYVEMYDAIILLKKNGVELTTKNCNLKIYCFFMQNEMMSLKLDNERLQQLIEQKGISTDSVLNSHRHSGPRQPHHPNTENRLSLDDPTNLGKYYSVY